MSKLNGQQFEQLQQARLSAFPTRSPLAQMLLFKLNRNLDEIVGNDPIKEILFQLIRTAEAGGWTEELIRGARAAVPGNETLRAFAEAYEAEEPSTKTVNQEINSNTPGLEPSADTSLQTNQSQQVINPANPLQIIVMIIFNLILLGTIAYAVSLWEQLSVLFPCVSPVARNVSVGVGLFLLLHVMVRFAPNINNLDAEINLIFLKIKVGDLAGAINFVHPRKLATWVLVISLIASISFCALILSAFSPFPGPLSPVPVIKDFSVQYPDGSETPINLTDTLEIRANQQVLITIEFLNQTNPQCIWSALKGTVYQAGDYSVIYNPPLGATTDSITVHLDSPCNVFLSDISLLVKVVP
jgi:hypothetical protein